MKLVRQRREKFAAIGLHRDKPGGWNLRGRDNEVSLYVENM